MGALTYLAILATVLLLVASMCKVGRDSNWLSSGDTDKEDFMRSGDDALND